MRLSVTDLVGHPGRTRALDRVVRRDEVGTPDDDWGPADEALDSPLTLDLHLDSVVEGILVRGTVGWDLLLPCARCTEPVPVSLREGVAELFADPRRLQPGEEPDEGYELIDDSTAIDLTTMLRDLVLLNLPVRVTCDGPCEQPEVEGVEVRTEDEERALRAARPDPRWGALADFVPAPDPDGGG